jgi:exodeoxyribonuclease V alpha subunit
MTCIDSTSAVAPPPEFKAIDRHFSDFIGGLSGNQREVKLAAALVSHARSLGHVCLDLRAPDAGASPLPSFDDAPWPEPDAWINTLRASPAVGRPGEFKPLIVDDAGRLYLHRYWLHETDLAARLKDRARSSPRQIDTELLRDGLLRLFPASSSEINWQMVAAFAALRKRLCVISGGPGTGKTRTVVVLLALMLEQHPELRVALAAPTGKAASRLQESVKHTKASLSCRAGVKEKLPVEATTIHRLLGARHDSTQFKHDSRNPLPFDVVIVDEASMVDLPLMARLLAALPDAAQIILLGDKDQLSSVEAGAVLADICGEREHRAFSNGFRKDYEQLAGIAIPANPPRLSGALDDCIVELPRNYRFGEQSGIYKLSQAVNESDSSRAIGLLTAAASGRSTDLASRPVPRPAALKDQLRSLVLESFAPYLGAKQPVQALELLGKFRILSPLRNGPYGVENINRLVEEILSEAGLVAGQNAFYEGRPVMITRNEHNLKLSNGDIGLILQDPTNSQLRAWFPAADGSARSCLPLRLPEHETAYALTVHKSQGSEFDRVLLILPGEDARILTRELLYTGMTRASKHVEVWFDPSVLRSAISRRTVRRSGLRDALWNNAARVGKNVPNA